MTAFVMRSAWPVVVVVVAVGCAGGADPIGPAPVTIAPAFGGNVVLGSCDGTSPGPALARCTSSAPPGLVAAVCGDLAIDNTLTVNAGALAVGGKTRIAAPLRVGGAFTGFGGIQADNTHDIDGDLRTAGDWVVHSPAHVGGDAVVGGKLDATNTVSIAGALHVAAAPPDSVSAASVSADGTAVTNVLACDHAPDVAALVATTKGLGVTDEGNVLSSLKDAADVTLGCGRWRFASIGIDNTLTFHIQGQTVIVVDGDVRVASPMNVILADGASLDFIIGGALDIENTFTFEGGPTWLAVGGAVKIASPTKLAGWLFAPKSDVSANNTLDVKGSMLVGSLHVASPIVLSAPPTIGPDGCAGP